MTSSFANQYQTILNEYDSLINQYPLLEYHLTFIKCHVIRHGMLSNGHWVVDKGTLLGLHERDIRKRLADAENYMEIVRICVNRHTKLGWWRDCQYCHVFKLDEPTNIKDKIAFNGAKNKASKKLFLIMIKR